MNSKGIHDETYRSANPVNLSTAILHQSINTAATRRSKLGVKTQKLSIIIGSKTVNCVGIPSGFYKSKHTGVTMLIIPVNELA